jgi:hypothetical protein
MNRPRTTLTVGILLILAGLLFLLQNLGYLGGGLGLLWAVLFILGGLAFIYWFLRNRAAWWALIPGFTLLGLGGLILLSTLFPEAGNVWGGALFLGSIGLAFVAVYLVAPQHWWAIIPAGTLITLALVAALGALTDGMETGGIFFLGLGATFLVLGVVHTPQGRLKWAFIPAGVLLVMGILLLAQALEILGYIWPLALIAAGLYVLYRAVAARPKKD